MPIVKVRYNGSVKFVDLEEEDLFGSLKSQSKRLFSIESDEVGFTTGTLFTVFI